MDKRLVLLCCLLTPILAWSAIKPHDYFTWFLEVAPVLVGIPIVIAVRRRFPLSSLLLVLIGVHCVILILGGHYTYARVPIGDWFSAWFGFTRNNYDKLGHFAQGFIPAILVREILLRTSPLANRGDGQPSHWLPFLAASVCLGFSALYEIIEWLTAEATGTAAEDFLGTQGYAWDTQSDMLLAIVGAVCALAFLYRLHDRSMARLAK